MNRLIFSKIKISNVLSIGPEIEYDFRDGKGLTYVYGVNYDTIGLMDNVGEEDENNQPSSGTGKSSCFTNAILLALYGKTINNINNRYLFNRTADWRDDGYIELSVNRNFLDDFKILVELRTNKKRDKCALKFTLFKNGLDITFSTKNETLKYIETEIIGCSFDIFKNTVIMSSSNLVNFFQMPMAQKNKYLQGIFSLDNIGKAYDNVTERITEIKKNLKLFNDKLFYINKTVTDLETQNSQWLDTHQHKLSVIKNKLKLEESIEINDIEKPKAFDKKQTAILKFDEYKEKKKDLEKKQKNIQKNINKLEVDIRVSKEIIDNNQELLDNLCDSCKPNIKKLFQIDSAENIILENNKKLEDEKTLFSGLEESLDKISTFLDKIVSAQLEITKYNNKVRELEQKRKHKETNIKSIQKDIEDLEKETNPFLSLISEHSITKQEVSKSLNKTSNLLQYFGELKNLFSDNGVKQFIIGDIVDALNNHIKTYLRKMNANFYVFFDTNLYYEFFTSSGPCEYFSFSAGERRKLDLAILFSFRDILSINSVQTNILTVDEILDTAIDTKTLNSLIEILSNKAKFDEQSIFIISHREALKTSEAFQHCIRVEKQNELTTICQEK